MRRYSWVVLVLLVVSLGASVRALPSSEVFDTFYDCALNENGWTLLSCSGRRYSDGTLSGAYRLREWSGCTDGGYTSQWYYWNGSSWVGFSGPPGPNC